MSDRIAKAIVETMFWGGNLYFRDNYIKRAIFLESVAGNLSSSAGYKICEAMIPSIPLFIVS